jgi:hypothetical protein
VQVYLKNKNMNYIITKLEYQNSAYANPDGTFSQAIQLTIGIEGDKFGFTQLANLIVNFLSTDSVSDVQTKIIIVSDNYLLTNYNS